MISRARIIVPSAIAILSILDGIATTYVFSIGVEESIPIAASAIESYGPYSIIFKVLLSILPCIVFYKTWSISRLSRYSCVIIALLYLGIDILHIWFLLNLHFN